MLHRKPIVKHVMVWIPAKSSASEGLAVKLSFALAQPTDEQYGTRAPPSMRRVETGVQLWNMEAYGPSLPSLKYWKEHYDYKEAPPVYELAESAWLKCSIGPFVALALWIDDPGQRSPAAEFLRKEPTLPEITNVVTALFT